MTRMSARPRFRQPRRQDESPAYRGNAVSAGQVRPINFWWRCGESNSGPKQTPGRCLQA